MAAANSEQSEGTSMSQISYKRKVGAVALMAVLSNCAAVAIEQVMQAFMGPV